jgi:hypothetical protein
MWTGFRALSSLVAIVLLISCSEQRATNSGPTAGLSNPAAERLRLVAGNAFAVTHPGYRIVFDDQVQRQGRNRALALYISPLWSDVNDSDQWPLAELAITQDISTAKVRAPSLPLVRIDHVLAEPARTSREQGEAAGRAMTLLSNIGSGVTLGAYIEYAAGGVPESKASRRVTISHQRLKRPFYWELGTCSSKGLPESCDQLSAQQQFKQWVALLQASDTAMLRDMGLDLSELRNAAAHGAIIGSLEVNASANRLRLLLSGKKVRMVYVVSARLACTSATSAECVLRQRPKE